MLITRLPQQQLEIYLKLVRGSASLGRIFTATDIPLIPPGLAEIIFTKPFYGDLVAGEDKCVDVILNHSGIGIKTFRGGNNSQKIAQFKNRERYPITENNPQTLAKEISEYRNQRLDETLTDYELNDNELFYHFTKRFNDRIEISECAMEKIDLNNIIIEQSSIASVSFSDNRNSYRYTIQDSQLYKRFPETDPLFKLRHEFLIEDIDERENLYFLIDLLTTPGNQKVILPLYSNNYIIHEKSGLNQWNAGGRERHENEVYIPIPRSIHVLNPNFFPQRDVVFNLTADNGNRMTAKVCQDGSKALMSNPNKDLGQWILRDVLNIEIRMLVTMETLIDRRIDSVIVEKIDFANYKISPAQSLLPGQQGLFN